MAPRALPLVAIVGRPNVGKSTLFNRLVGRRLAIVEDVPGVTRDRHHATAEWGTRQFTVVDTGGFLPVGAAREAPSPGDEKGEKASALAALVRQQAQAAVEECDVTILVLDVQSGLTAADEDLARYLRRSGKPVVVCANKVDDERHHLALAADFHRLGLGEVHATSAEHGRGMEALCERVLALLPAEVPAEPPPEGEEEPLRVAIVGRPNVGKSTLVNALLGEERLIASALPGTTRDPIDSELTFKGRRLILTDTAGIRRKKTIAQRVEAFAVLAALRAVEKSDVVVLVMDATEPAVDQDAKIAAIAEERGRALVVVVNKWDQVKKKPGAEEELRAELKYQLKFVSYAPMLFTSALTGAKVEKVLELALQLHEQQAFRAPTPQLNRLLEHITTEHPAPFAHGRAVRLYYCAQVGTQPPTFKFLSNLPQEIPDRYKRYIVNRFRETFGLKVPIRLVFRERPGKGKREAKVRAMKAASRRRR